MTNQEAFEKQAQLKQLLTREFESVKRTEFWKSFYNRLSKRREYFARKCVTDKVVTEEDKVRLIMSQSYVQVLDELLGLPDRILEGKIA